MKTKKYLLRATFILAILSISTLNNLHSQTTISDENIMKVNVTDLERIDSLYFYNGKLYNGYFYIYPKTNISSYIECKVVNGEVSGSPIRYHRTIGKMKVNLIDIKLIDDLYFYNGKLYTGYFYNLYSNKGNVLPNNSYSEGELIKGERSGTWRWYTDNKLSEEIKY